MGSTVAVLHSMNCFLDSIDVGYLSEEWTCSRSLIFSRKGEHEELVFAGMI